MTPMQILNQLYAEKKITLAFDSSQEREAFRQRIYKLKKIQDEAISAVLDEERLVLRARNINEVTGIEGVSQIERWKLELWTEEKKAPTYTVLSVSDKDGGEKEKDAGGSSSDDRTDPQEIPENLANPDGKAN